MKENQNRFVFAKMLKKKKKNPETKLFFFANCDQDWLQAASLSNHNVLILCVSRLPLPPSEVGPETRLSNHRGADLCSWRT